MTGKLLVVLSVSLGLYASQRNLIESMTITKNKVTIVPNKELKTSFLREDFFVKYGNDIDLEKMDTSIVMMPFLLQILSTVWLSGNVYYVDSMDEELFYSLQRIKKVFSILYPKTRWDGEIIPHTLVKNTLSQRRNPDKEVALLFSGGLDSTCSSYYLAEKKQLLVTCWGQWDVPLGNKALWQARKKQIETFAQKHEHDAAFIKSNYVSLINYKAVEERSSEISNWRAGAIEGIGLLGLAAPVLYAKGYQVMYIASSDSWDLEYPSVDIPYIDDNLSFGQTRLKHHLFSMSRMQKIEWFSHELKKYGRGGERIKGCDDRSIHNCCHCDRCFQTLGMLFLVGQNAKSHDYKIVRENAIAGLRALALRDELSFEVLYNFICMIDFIQRQQQEGEEIPEDLLWLTTIPFDLAQANDIAGQQKIDWKKLHRLFPKIRDVCGKQVQLLRNQFEAGKREQGVPYTAHVSFIK